MSARERLLLAAAKAYIEAHKLPPDARPEDYARWLGSYCAKAIDARCYPEMLALELPVQITLGDVLELSEAARSLPVVKAQAAEDMAYATVWLQAWRKASEALTATPSVHWKTRASAALREMWLLGRTKRTASHPALLARWSALTDRHSGPPEGPRMSQRAALLLISSETGIEPGTIKKRLQREGVNVTARDL